MRKKREFQVSMGDEQHTNNKVNKQQVAKSRGQHCGDIELSVYIVNVTGLVSLVLDLRITHDLFGRICP